MQIKKAIIPILALAGILASAPAQAQDERNYIGVEVGWFFPTDGLIRDRFDDAILRVGIGPVFNRNLADWKTSYELGFVGASDDGNRFTVVPLTVGLQKSFGNLEADFVPYAKGAIGVAYIDFDIDDDSGRGFSPVGVVEVGVQGGRRFKAALKYMLVGERDGIDFSGTTLSVSYGLFEFRL